MYLETLDPGEWHTLLGAQTGARCQFLKMMDVLDVLEELHSRPRVDTAMLNLLSTWLNAVAEARGPGTCRASLDLAAVTGYVALHLDKLDNDGAWDPVLTVADVMAFAERPANGAHIEQALACLRRNTQRFAGLAWPELVAGTPEELAALRVHLETVTDAPAWP